MNINFRLIKGEISTFASVARTGKRMKTRYNNGSLSRFQFALTRPIPRLSRGSGREGR